jgi:hypothetical protein
MPRERECMSCLQLLDILLTLLTLLTCCKQESQLLPHFQSFLSESLGRLVTACIYCISILSWSQGSRRSSPQ